MKKKTSSKKPRPSKEVKAELDKLTKEFEAALKFESTAKANEEEEAYQALLDKLVGRRVIITRNDEYGGKIATVKGPKGKSKKPLYWELKLEDSSVIWKTRDHFRLLPVGTTPSK